MSLRIPYVGYKSLIPILEMIAFIGQKSRNFSTFILGRASLTQPLYPVGRINHDLYTRSEGLILIFNFNYEFRVFRIWALIPS